MKRTRPDRERRTERPPQSTGQLLWLIFAVVVTAAPHLLHLQPWVPVVMTLIIAWRLCAAAFRWHLPGLWVRVPLTILGFVAVLVSYRQVSGLAAGSALLLIMVSMKLLETRGYRDRAIVVFICYFLLFAAFLREQAIWSAGYLLAGVLVTTAALYQIARAGTIVPAPRAMAMAFRLVAQAAPLMLLLFFLFPRIPGPFWTLPTGDGAAQTGLSNEMTPGDITELAQSDEVAFRVRFDGAAPASADLYWRGPVMTHFTGRTWRAGDFDGRWRAPPDDATGTTVGYEVTLEPGGRRWLFALDTPVRWDAPQAGMTQAFQLVHASPIDRRYAYHAHSVLTRSLTEPDEVYRRGTQTSLPAGRNPRTLALARTLRESAAGDRAYLDGILAMFRQQEFFYTLTPPSLHDNTVDEFLFDTRRGFCGHYASAFTVLARAAGIPARIVTGYQGAEYNPVGGYWIVRQSNAHAWVETWLDGRWLRFDPTSAVAPWRIERGFADAADRRSAGAPPRRTSSLLNRVVLSWDAVNAGWNRWILGFGPESQFTMMRFAGIEDPKIEYLVVAAAVAVTALLIVIGLWQRRGRRPRREPLQAAYRRLCRRLARAARPRAPHEGPAEYAATVARLRPDMAAQTDALFGQYIALRYDAHASENETVAFIRAVRAFRPPHRAPGARGSAAAGLR